MSWNPLSGNSPLTRLHFFLYTWPSHAKWCSKTVDKNAFPNTSGENCTFTAGFETGKWLISQLYLFSPLHFNVSKPTMKVQLSLDVLGKITRFTLGEQPKCELSKLIIRHNIGPISAANSRLLLGQCRHLHQSSAGPTTAAFVNCLNLPTLSRNLA